MARLFDNGSNEYLGNASAVVTAVPLALACWAYRDDDTAFSHQTLMGVFDEGGVNYFDLEFRHNGGANRLVWARTLNVTAGTAQAAATWSPNTWHHVCGVFAATDDRACFLDGGNEGTDSTDKTPVDIDITLVGCRDATGKSQFFSGRIAEAAIWNVALTDAEVAILAKGYSPLFVRPQNLAAYWPLIRDEDQDRVGGYDLTAYNTPSIAVHPPVIYPAPVFYSFPVSAAAPQTINMDALALAGSAESLTQSSGAVQLAMDALVLAGSVKDLTQSSGAVQLTMDALVLAGSAPSLTQASGAVSLAMDALTLAGSAEGLTQSSGAVQLAMGLLALASSVKDSSVSPGAVTLAMDRLTLSGSAESLTVSLAIVIAMSALVLSSSPKDLGVSPGAVQLAMDALALASSAKDLTVSAVIEIITRAFTMYVDRERAETMNVDQGRSDTFKIG